MELHGYEEGKELPE